MMHTVASPARPTNRRVLALALPTGRLTRPAGALLLAAYPAFIALVLAS